jgi:hypothetical protein
MTTQANICELRNRLSHYLGASAEVDMVRALLDEREEGR